LSRAVWLAVGLVLALPPLHQGWALLASTGFLVEFLSDGRWRPLSAITEAPAVRPLSALPPGLAADLYLGPSFVRPPGLVLVHGIAPRGKDDPQLREAAALLARAGWAVAVPTVGGLTRLRLRPEDASAVAAAIRALAAEGYRPVAVLGVSLGSSPALLAAGDPEVAPSVSAVLALGGYASALELLRYTLTGSYALGEARGRRPIDEDAIARFAAANAELVDGAGRRLVDNRDPAAVDRLAAELPPETRRLLDALSPERAVGRLTAPLFLVHGRDDPAVPFTESLRLDRAARAAGRRPRTTIVGAMSHVDPDARATLGDLARLWAAFYSFRITSARASPRPESFPARRWATRPSSRPASSSTPSACSRARSWTPGRRGRPRRARRLGALPASGVQSTGAGSGATVSPAGRGRSAGSERTRCMKGITKIRLA
jgi:fermentation-respiration switch protein FrsA (DUF1100 family)